MQCDLAAPIQHRVEDVGRNATRRKRANLGAKAPRPRHNAPARSQAPFMS